MHLDSNKLKGCLSVDHAMLWLRNNMNASWPNLARHYCPLLPPAPLHPQQQWASWVGQGEEAGPGAPLQTSWLAVVVLHHLKVKCALLGGKLRYS